MVIVHNIRKKKSSGGRYKSTQTKRLAQKGDSPAHTKIGSRRVKSKHTIGGHVKKSLLSHDTVNVFDVKSKKSFGAKITNVEKNTASRHFERRNIITKGSIIETDKGRVKVTNRPGQEAAINGILI